MTELVKVNDWVDALDGIAQVLEIKQIYKEKYPLTSLPPKQNQDGELINTIIIHKILCDFEGKLCKRNVVQHCSLEICTPICSDSEKVLLKLKECKPKELDKFDAVSQTKDFNNYINTWVRVGVGEVQEIVEFLNYEFKASQFEFSDITDSLKSRYKFDDSWDFFTAEAEGTSQIVLRLNNTNYEFKDKKAIFTGLQAQVV